MPRGGKIVVGRTIGERREHLETANERAAAREKDKRKNRLRILSVSIALIAFIGVLVLLARIFFTPPTEPTTSIEPEPTISYEPTIEIIDSSASSTGGKITSRMKSFIGMIESDLKPYGYKPIKAVIPVDSIREVDLYLEGYNGYIKTTIDRDAAVTAEDIDRMLRYLAGQGVTDFEYLDVRTDGRAFWK